MERVTTKELQLLAIGIINGGIYTSLLWTVLEYYH
jgi:hypothetical protein